MYLLVFNVGIIFFMIAKTIFFHRTDDALEETGWKLVHGDVFRPPQYPMLLVAWCW